MNQNAIVISERVLCTIQSLPEGERKAIFNAFVCDEIYKIERDSSLSPFQEMLYAIIKDYINRDSIKYTKFMEKERAS